MSTSGDSMAAQLAAKPVSYARRAAVRVRRFVAARKDSERATGPARKQAAP